MISNYLAAMYPKMAVKQPVRCYQLELFRVFCFLPNICSFSVLVTPDLVGRDNSNHYQNGKIHSKFDRDISRFETWITQEIFKISACIKHHSLTFWKSFPMIPNIWQYDQFCVVLDTRKWLFTEIVIISKNRNFFALSIMP